MKFVVLFAMVLSVVFSSCRSTPKDEASDLDSSRRKGATGFALIGCNSTKGWIATDQGNCSMPYKLCYIGSQNNTLLKIASGSIYVSEEFALKKAKATGGIFIRAEIWDMPNNSKSETVTFTSCKGKVRGSVLASAKKPPVTDEDPVVVTGLSCKRDNGKWYPLEDTEEMCSEELELCYDGDQEKVIKSVKAGINIFDEYEIRNPASVSSSEFKVDLWDMPNDELSKQVTVKKCKK